MHSEEPTHGVELKRVTVHRQHCTLGPVLAGKNPQCSVNFTELIGEPEHAVKGSTTYLPNAKGRAVTSSTIASCCRRRLISQRLPATRSRSSSCPLPSPQLMPHLTPPRGRRRRERRPPLWLLQRPQPTTHQLQRHCHLPPPPQRKARRPARLRTSPMWVSTTNLASHY